MKFRKIVSVILALTMLAGLMPAAFGEDKPCRHVWELMEGESEEPTCYSEGVRMYRCINCGDVEREVVPKSHSYGPWKTEKEATCTENGRESRKCRKCGNIEKRWTKKADHTWSEWAVFKEPTALSAGMISRFCQVCGTGEEKEYYPEGTLFRGDKGEAVTALQELLNKAGFNAGKADGDFGRGTERAVKAAEEAFGLTADGIGWPGLVKLLRSGSGEGGGYGWEPPKDDADEEEDFGWEPPEDDEEEPDNGGAVSPASFGPDAPGAYDYDVEQKEYVSGKGLSVGDWVEVPFSITNTGTRPIVIQFHTSFSDKLVSWDTGDLQILYWDYTVHMPGDSSTITIKRQVEAKDLEDPAYVPVYCAMIALPLEYFIKDETTGKYHYAGNYPDEWPARFDSGEGHSMLRSDVAYVAIGDPLLDLKLSYTDCPRKVDEDNVPVNLTILNLGCEELYGFEADLYVWDKDAGKFAFRETITSEDVHFPPYTSKWADDPCDPYLYPVTLSDLENSEDGTARIAFQLRSHLLNGEEISSELKEAVFYPYLFNVQMDPDIPAEGMTVPDDGWLKVKLKISNLGSDVLSYYYDSSYLYDPVTDTYSNANEHELHDYDMEWFEQGASEDTELWLRVFPEDIKAGVLRREYKIAFKRWFRENGRSVFSDTPKDKASKSYSAEYALVELAIPFAEEKASAPAYPDHCVIAYLASGEGTDLYRLTRCAKHDTVLKNADKLLREAEDAAAGWQAAAVLWQEALDKEYEELLTGADETLRAAIETEKACFLAQMEAHCDAISLSHPDDPALVSQAAAQILMRKTLEMCWEAGTAPGKRSIREAKAPGTLAPADENALCGSKTIERGYAFEINVTYCADHREIILAEEAGAASLNAWLSELNTLTNERYLATKGALRNAITDERTSFGAWLEAREALLTLLCPDDPDIVQDLLAQAIRSRVTELCGEVR